MLFRSNPHESPWEGSRICRKKNLKSIDFLRQKILKKNIRYPFWRIDKEKSIQLIDNGGWHFNYLLEPEKISKKLNLGEPPSGNLEKYLSFQGINLLIITRVPNTRRCFFTANNLYHRYRGSVFRYIHRHYCRIVFFSGMGNKDYLLFLDPFRIPHSGKKAHSGKIKIIY